MADIREQIIDRLVTVCGGISGVVAVARNALDVPALARPAILVNDGSEALIAEHRAARFSEKQLMELSPQVILLVRADNGSEAGTLLSQFRNRILVAVLGDVTLRSLVMPAGRIRYEGVAQPELTPESKEPRLEVQFVFTYPLILSEIT